MFSIKERAIFREHDPIELYKQLMTAFDGDPQPLLNTAASEDEGSRQYGRDQVKERLHGLCTERLFLDFMKWVSALRAEYKPFVEAGLLLVRTRQTTYRDVCGYWFNKDLPTYRNLWSAYVAGKRLRDGTLPPPEAFEAVATCPAEAQEMNYDAEADAWDRAATGRSRTI
jgi:hypothetical protein